MSSATPQSVRLLVLGLNHKTAPLPLREAVAFDAAQIAEALRRFQESFPDSEAVVLSTCNRVELYIARPVEGQPNFHLLVQFLAEFHGMPASDLHGHIYHHEDRAMVEHLFAVAASLDSMVVGETQILAQVKQAYQAATTAGAARKVLHSLFQRALAAAKSIHDQTDLAAGRLSIASVAVDLSRSVFDRFDDKAVVCVGAGKMSRLMLRHLSELSPGTIVVTNRSPDRAEALAAEFKAVAVPWQKLEELLVQADIVLTSTGSPEPVITTARFKSLLKARRYRPVVIVDIAVPRDVEAGVGELSNVYLYNIDDLEQVAAATRDKRSAAVDRSRELLAGFVEEFIAWYATRDVGPLVKALYEHSNALARAELDAYFAGHPQMDDAQRKDLERMVHRVVGKMLHTPVTQITQQAHASARPMLAAALRKLFALGDESSSAADSPGNSHDPNPPSP